MKLKKLIEIGSSLYRCRISKPINYRWLVIFLVRCFIFRKEINKIENFFNSTELGKKFFETRLPIWFQITRENFFRDSKASERVDLMINSWKFFEKHFNEEDRNNMYCEDDSHAICLWEQNFEDKILKLELNFINGDIKEGCATLSLIFNNLSVYHMNFWIGEPDENQNYTKAYIGCHQGSKDGLDVNRDLTKILFGCRPKNFVFIALQELLSHLGITELYAVSSEGHYSNKFHGDKRKPKVSYNDFWTECGGTICPDKRFFSMPLHDKRKSMEEIPSKKRSTYRKRYELLDQVSATIKSSCKNQQPKK